MFCDLILQMKFIKNFHSCFNNFNLKIHSLIIVIKFKYIYWSEKLVISGTRVKRLNMGYSYK